MTLSTYNVIRKHEKDIVILNTLTGVEVCVDDELYTLISNGGEARTEREKNYINQLTEYGILAETRKADRTRLRKWLSNENSNEEELNVTLALTYACNLSCSYCYLKHLSGTGLKLSGREVVNWIKRKLEHSNYKALFLSFFGGEPLLESEKIFTISKNLKEFCRKIHVDFSFDITTNGTLLQPELLRSLTNLGLASVNVTMDGDESTHNSGRPFKNGRGSFNRIMSNILAVSRSFKEPRLNLIINVRKKSKNAIISLIKSISEQNLSIRHIRFKPVVDTQGKISSSCLFPPEFVPVKKELAEFAIKQGLEVYDNTNIGPCGFHKESDFVIGADNMVYPCTPFIGNRDYSMGNILDGENLKKFHLKLPEKCYNCAYAPICAGGCRYVSFLDSGNVENVYCEKRYFDQVFEPCGNP